MKPPSIPSKPALEYAQRVRQHARTQATDLVSAARSILEVNVSLAHVAYVLAVFALEEVGKAELAAMSIFRFGAVEEAAAWLERHGEDHVQKLFWALWGPSFGREVITRGQIEESRMFAHVLHDRRIRALYATHALDGSDLPAGTVSAGQARDLVDLVEARLPLLQELPASLDPQSEGKLSWFLVATEDPERRPLIFGAASMKRLAELGGVAPWIDWLKVQFDEAEQIAQDQLQRELKRQRRQAKGRDKWRILLRLESASHSIHPGPLKWWNGISGSLKLRPIGNRKNALQLELILPDSIMIDGLWPAALGVIQGFVIAINVGSLGFFWYNPPAYRVPPYESIKDLDTGTDVVITPAEAQLDWGRNALTEEDLRRAALVLSLLPRSGESEASAVFGQYLAGLAMIAKTDIRLSLVQNAFQCFREVLRLGLAHYQGWDQQNSVADALRAVIPDVIDFMEDDNGSRWADRLASVVQVASTLEDAAKLKTLCDAYLIQTLGQVAREKRTVEG